MAPISFEEVPQGRGDIKIKFGTRNHGDPWFENESIFFHDNISIGRSMAMAECWRMQQCPKTVHCILMTMKNGLTRTSIKSEGRKKSPDQ